MNQKAAIAIFCSGLAVTLTSLGELFATHKMWSELSTPSEVGHMLVIASALIATIAGALSIQMPRNGSQTDRVSDVKLKELNKDE